MLELHGLIGGRIRTPQFLPLVEAARRAGFVKGVVLDVDSRGGEAAASEYLHIALAKLAREKPLVAFVRGTGTSGAYLAACAASRIVALPTSVVGSIGVLSLRPIAVELLHRAGVDVSVHKSGRFKDMGAFWREPTEEEQTRLQALVDELYDAFIERVAETRQLDVARVRELATGEVFTGRRGKEVGLVDELGDLDRAVQIVAEQAQAPPRRMTLRPRPSLRERLFRRVAEAAVQGALDVLEERLARRIW